jgi:hypothetical protein
MNVSVVVPAFNEATVIPRLLESVGTRGDGAELDIVVVANGCTDHTAAVARLVAPEATVVEIAEASKFLALEAGDRSARFFPRFYVDGDVVIDRKSIDLLCAALAAPGVHAVAPERHLDSTSAGRLVRAYFDVWQTLPAVRGGLYGRGVLGVDEEGYGRITPRPAVIGDDLHVHQQFTDSERQIVSGAFSLVKCPQTVTALVARRTRAALGNTELGRPGFTGGTASGRAVIAFSRSRPLESWKAAVFMAVTLAARWRARRMRRSGVVTWLRDETSRAAS